MGEQVSRILVVDDDPHVGKVLFSVLRQAGHEPRHETSAAAALKAVEDGSFDLVISDIRMPGMDGIELLGELKKRDPAMPVVMITAHGSVKLAVEAMKLGAAEFVEKPFDNAELVGVVAHEIKKSAPAREAPPRFPAVSPSGVAGNSPQLRASIEQLDKIARAGMATVLVEGESGTGKELIGHAIHDKSPRSAGPFIAVNCAALSKGIVESGLFGHVKGAFTGAVKDYAGCVGLAEGGTLFLDEIGELPLDIQPKLLRLLESHEYMRLGGTETRKADVRFVAATNRNLDEMVAEGRFRQDILYRLNVFRIVMPPLREREGDIDELATRFLADIGAENRRPAVHLDEEARTMLRGHAFPGNVRELKNVVERLVVFAEADTLGVTDVERALGGGPSSPSLSNSNGESLKEAREAAEKEKILTALRACRGNKTQTGRIIGVSRRTVYNLMKTHGIPLDFS